MESKQELRDRITQLESELRYKNNDIKTLKDNFIDLSKRYDALLIEATETQRAIVGLVKPLMLPTFQKMIDDSIHKLSIEIDCDYGGHIQSVLQYNGQTIDSDSDTVVTRNNPDEY